MRRRISRNPWVMLPPAELAQQGRVTITTGLLADELRFSRTHLVNVVKSVASASIVFQVGVTHHWGKEPSAQVILLNVSETGAPIMPWRLFVEHSKLIGASIAHALAQQVVLVETQAASGHYATLTYQNHDAGNERQALRAQRASMVGRRR